MAAEQSDRNGWRVASGLLRLASASALASVGILALAAEERVRTWKDASGQFEIKAFFVSEENGTVTLKQEDGEILEIELDQLSMLDKNFINSQKAKAANPFKAKGSAPAAKSPFRGKGATPARTTPRNTPADNASEDVAEASPAGSEISVDWSAAQLIQNVDESHWDQIKIEAAPAAGALKAAQLPKKRDFFEKLTGFVRSGTTAVVSYKLESRGGGDKTISVRLVTVDLQSGRRTGEVTIEGDFALLDIAPSGALLMKKDTWGFGNQEQIEIWTVAGKTVDRQVACTPFGDENGPGRDVRWAAFIDDSKVVVLSGGGKLGAFDVSTGAADYLASFTNQTAVALSPDRKYLAVCAGPTIQILDANSGEALAGLTAENVAFPALAFSPDGQRLCLQGSDRVTSWNLTDGSLYRDVVLTGLNFVATIPPVCPTAEHVLVGGSILIDLDRYVRLWTFNGAEAAAAAGDAALFCVGSHSEAGAIVPTKLPHEGAKKTLEAAMKDPNFFIVKPGMAVRIDVAGVPDAAQQQRVRESLAKNAAASGLMVAENAPITLTASVTNGGNDELTFRSFGFGFGEKTVTVTKWVSAVKMIVNGQSAFETSMVAVPHFINRTEDESIEQAVRKANVPNYQFFQSVGIPGYVMKPTGGQTLGASQITASGIR
ncbi:MAG: hypothetical protein KF774_20955 [Planctomyces sp.]|nr:hypothetical protein [Planctomyces sp.]